jgi:hypothetical protein
VLGGVSRRQFSGAAAITSPIAPAIGTLAAVVSILTVTSVF